MLDWVPIHAWLLLIIGLICWPAAVVVSKRLRLSEFDSSRPEPRATAIAGAVLMLGVLLSIFIFSPQAEEFARSPQFLQIVFGLMAGGVTFWTIEGFMTGQVEPLIRGTLGPYSRDAQPRRYWISQTWNVLMTLALVWAAFVI